MGTKNKVFLLWVSLFMIMFISGCVSLPQNQRYSELEERIVNMEERMDKMEEKCKKMEDMSVTATNKVPLKKKIDKIEPSKQFIKFPSNEDIQVALKNAGFYDGEIDGQIGSKTRNAIKEFQKQNDLEVDGVVGRNTWDVLGKYYYLSDEEAPAPIVKEEVKEVKKETKKEAEEEIKEEAAAQTQAND